MEQVSERARPVLKSLMQSESESSSESDMEPIPTLAIPQSLIPSLLYPNNRVGLTGKKKKGEISCTKFPRMFPGGGGQIQILASIPRQ
jgi:hypothetical protein